MKDAGWAQRAHWMPALAALWCFGGLACQTPLVRNLVAESAPTSPMVIDGRTCTIALGGVRDVRPIEEVEGDDQVHYRYFVLVGPMGWVASDELDFHDPENLGDVQVEDAVAEGVKQALVGGPCRWAKSESAEFVLNVDIRHLYGLSATYDRRMLGLLAGDVLLNRFYPAGQATLAFELVDRRGTVVDSWEMAEGSLFDFDGSQEVRDRQRTGRSQPLVEDARTGQLINALKHVYERLPARVDQALAQASPASPSLTGRFFIVRLLEDYERMEIATIDMRTGVVLDAEIVRRPYPIFSAPNRWVVSPYQPAHLSHAQYDRLIKSLGARFDVRFDRNLSAASFYGLKGT